MHLPAKFAVRMALLSCCALAIAANTTIHAQEAKPKPTVEPAKTETETKQDPAAQRKMGTELDGPVIINTDLITLTVTVTDTYGRYVSGLTKNAFTLLDQKVPQEITFFSDEDSPVSVGVIFDVSGSMSGEKVRKAREALSKFIQTSHNSDEYFLIGFNSRAQLLLDKTRDGNAVLDKLMFVETRNNTALYDACYLGVEKVQRGAHPKRALLLISDGQDNNSRYTLNELRRLLKESDVVLYGIGILSGNDASSALGMEGQGILDELANIFQLADANVDQFTHFLELPKRLVSHANINRRGLRPGATGCDPNAAIHGHGEIYS